MRKQTYRSQGWPECTVTFDFADGADIYNLSRSQARAGGWDGHAVYDVFERCVTSWQNAPMLRGETAPDYDRLAVRHLLPAFVVEIVSEIVTVSTLSEDEIKNLSSQLMSEASQGDSIAASANAAQADSSTTDAPPASTTSDGQPDTVPSDKSPNAAAT